MGNDKNWKRSIKPLAEPNVLVGFGKRRLVDLVKFLNTTEEDKAVKEPYIKQWPPIYRRLSACTNEEIECFKEYTTFITKFVARKNNA